MTAIPQLQVALDFISLPAALAIALKVADEVDVIEIGTPLCKAAGLEAIRAVREVCPDKLILADLKSPDVGGLEAAMAFDAGADMMTVIGGAALATVEEALRVAQEKGKEMLMELTGVRDIIGRATEWREIGVERMVYHRGWDEQTHARQWEDEDRVVIRRLIDMGFKITVTGGITVDLLPFFQELPVSIIIAGRAIHQAEDPAASARLMRSTIHQLWGGPGDGMAADMAFADRAAMENLFRSAGFDPKLDGLLVKVREFSDHGHRVAIHHLPQFRTGKIARDNHRTVVSARQQWVIFGDLKAECFDQLTVTGTAGALEDGLHISHITDG